MVLAGDCDNNTPFVVVFPLFMLAIVLDIFTFVAKSEGENINCSRMTRAQSCCDVNVF